jgi:hypothetical protein
MAGVRMRIVPYGESLRDVSYHETLMIEYYTKQSGKIKTLQYVEFEMKI